MKAKERGSSSIRIDLRGATITVYHGSTNEVLKTFTAYEGAWDTIWEGINNAKEVELSKEQNVELSLLDNIKSDIQSLMKLAEDLGDDSLEIISARGRMTKKIDSIESKIKPINSMISDYESKVKELGIEGTPQVVRNAKNEIGKIRKKAERFRSDFL